MLLCLQFIKKNPLKGTTTVKSWFLLILELLLSNFQLGSDFVKQLFWIQKGRKVLLWNQVKSRMEACYSELILAPKTPKQFSSFFHEFRTIWLINCLKSNNTIIWSFFQKNKQLWFPGRYNSKEKIISLAKVFQAK